ncbi:Mut7-C ubiquitin/RNAse domain-containing protein [Massilia soli]|uniref:Mut7-C ubiquitin/RNAse domain-containing protein n=2 Tax=Pseudomonadota TaxID=1224 RepID=A0ABS7SPP4_9BURK|nr:Mut7-C ubiquitin/RNAse domain-containing protein [Massilia soli]MBZ2208147.1 Mut7-C ubiquitin/RNAse domain-containing protein [Massilia soli]
MVTATFRFYGELNDFLPRSRRRRDFTIACARAATAKHMIEAIGVPHTEVELILVNGASRTFDQLLGEGDRVAVYPKFAALDISDLQRVRAGPRAFRFVADAHLGGLARLLRMAGFDTLYDNNYMDEEIEQISLTDQRIALTRDRELLKRRGITHGCYVHAIRSEEQLREIVMRLDLAGSIAPFTLCLKCNAPLQRAARADVLERLPARVRAHHSEFCTCGICQGVFWKGSHWQRMCAVLARATAPGSVNRS